MSTQKFNSVGVIGRQGSPHIDESLRAVITVLKTHACDVLVEDRTARLLSDQNERLATRAELSICDLLVVVGGDGSILGVARDLAHTNTPVLGVNRGGLGFLADIAPNHIEAGLKAVLSGSYRTESHFLLECSVERGDNVVHSSPALNDVIVSAKTLSRMIDVQLYIDDEFVYEQRSDGLLVSSPTGSTAYSLSAGGPIMHPSLDAIAIIPMFPHTLTARPIVVPGNFRISVLVGTDPDEARVSADSQVDFTLKKGDKVHIGKYEHRLNLIHPTTHSFYEACRSKLDWASRLVRG